jgi:hypothetical protein
VPRGQRDGSLRPYSWLCRPDSNHIYLVKYIKIGRIFLFAYFSSTVTVLSSFPYGVGSSTFPRGKILSGIRLSHEYGEPYLGGKRPKRNSGY